MPRRLEFENVHDFQATAMTHEENEMFYREVAETTVKPVLKRLREIYDRHGRRVPWNQIVALGMQLYSLVKRGKDVSLTLALELARNYPGLDRRIVEEIWDAVVSTAGTAPAGGGRARR